MTARSTRGVNVFMTKADATGTPVTPTAITKAKPAVVTVADVTGFATGNVIQFPAGSTGLQEIDGRNFVLGAVDDTANTFELLGTDTTASTGTFVSAPGPMVYEQSDMVKLCLSGLTFNRATPTTVSVGTYCDPTSTIASEVTEAGTVEFTGYIDITQPDYIELLAAEADGEQRVFLIELPSNGYIMFPATITQINQDIPIAGALGYTGNAVLGSKPTHVF